MTLTFISKVFMCTHTHNVGDLKCLLSSFFCRKILLMDVFCDMPAFSVSAAP